jgi:hypothetical protein
MRLPPKDPEQRDFETRLSRDDVLYALRRHGVSVEVEEDPEGGDAICTMISDQVAEVQLLPAMVGGRMVEYLARKFGIEKVQMYYARKLDEQSRRGPMQ